MRRAIRLALLGAAALSWLPPTVAAASPPAHAGPKSLVALGDSFASAPLVPVQTEQPWGCFRSGNNYAHQLAAALALELTDMTCSGAQTKDMWDEQGTQPEEELGQPLNPAQLSALSADTDIVTLQIGGNDIGFVDLAVTCGRGIVTGRGCQAAVNELDPKTAIDETAPKIAAVLNEIHTRSRGASIYVLGYPGIFKIGASASCPAMLALEEDAKFLRGIHESLNAMIERVAEAEGQPYSDATSYVDVYAPSAGHTACDLPAIRWVEPIVPVNAAFPVHPNLGGMSAIRDILIEAVWPRGLPRREAPPGLPAPPDAPL